MIAAAALVALSIAAAADPACSLPPLRDAPPPFRTGEVLAYDFDVMGIVKAGTLSLTVEPPISRGTLIPLRARIRNSSVFSKIRRVKGFALSWISADTLRPQRYRDETEEDGIRKFSDTRLDVRGGPITMAWDFGDRRGTAELEPAGAVVDVLSLIYYLRAAVLTPEKELCADVVANRRFWHFRGALARGTERVQSPAGAFDTVRLDGVLTRADGTGGKRPIHWWFTRDERHLPVAAVSEVDLGPVRVVLTRVTAPPPPPAPGQP